MVHRKKYWYPTKFRRFLSDSLLESKNASRRLALSGQDAMMSSNDYTPGVTFCQGLSESKSPGEK